MQLKLIWMPFIFIFPITTSNLIELFYNISNVKDPNELFLKAAIDCVKVIIYKNLPCGALITLISTIKYTDQLNKLLSDTNCYEFIVRSAQSRTWLIRTDVYIIYLINSGQLYSSLQELSTDTAWNPRVQFVVFIYDLEWSKYDEVFKLFLKLNIYNIILITISEKAELQVNTYNPFDNKACGNSFDKVINIKSCEAVDTIGVNYKQLENKFRNCTINIAAIEDDLHFIFKRDDFDGVEQQMLANIAKRENITLQYILNSEKETHGLVLPNFTVTGVLHYLQNDSISIVAGGYAFMSNRLNLFDCIWGYNFGELYLFIPARNEFDWSKVYRTFSRTTWLLVAFSYFFVIAVTFILKQYLGEDLEENNMALKLWGYLFGNTNDRLLRIKNIRMIVIVWIWFTFLVTSFYSTAFYTLLTTKETRKEIFTESQVRSLPLKPCICNSMRALLKYTYNVIISEKSPSYCQWKSNLDVVANNDKFYTITTDHTYNVRKFNYIDDKGGNKLKKKRYVSDVMYVMYTKRGFPLQAKFKKYAHYHFETGLIKKYLETIYHRHNILSKHVGSSFRNMTLSDFRVHFGILLFGYIISSVCFIFEILLIHYVKC